MPQKHLKTGDALPPYNGKLRLFSMRFCPFGQRNILVLNAKNLDYDLVYVNLQFKPDWLLQYSPKGTVPALEYEAGKALYDSDIINVYLDNKYPKVRLQSTDPLRQALDKIIVENFSPAQSAFYTGFSPSAPQYATVKNYHSSLEGLQNEIKARGTRFLYGDQPGLVDYTIWPFLERFEALPLIGKKEFVIDRSKYEILLDYMDNMKNFPIVKSYYLSPEVHAKFMESRANGDPNYDNIPLLI